jgi:hypothetical protein
MARSSRASSAAVVVCAATIVVAQAGRASAHRLDEYLQAARLDIELSRVGLELDMTPGIEVAAAIIADIDRDGDGIFSPEEQAAYASHVLDAIQLQVDGRPLRVGLTSFSFPEPTNLRGGEGVIQLRSAAELPGVHDGSHRLFFRNRHRRDVSVYLANALAPANARLDITAQTRDLTQSDLNIDYVVRPAPISWLIWLSGCLACALVVGVAARSAKRERKRDPDPHHPLSTPLRF